MAARIEQIERDLHMWAAKPVQLTFDARGTHTVSMMELAYSYAKRCADFADAIRSLLAKDMIVPAVVVGRALIETVAMGCLFLHDMRRLPTPEIARSSISAYQSTMSAKRARR